MANDSDLEKTEPASPRRMEKAREDGDVPRSRELATCTILMAAGAGAWMLSDRLIQAISTALAAGLTFSREQAFDSNLLMMAQGARVNQLLLAFAPLAGLAGAIITKLDEAATLGNVLDVVIRYRLGLYYVANGQRVPEDLMVANQHYLIEQAFKLQRESSAFEFREMELPLVMGNAARTMHNRAGKEAIHG